MKRPRINHSKVNVSKVVEHLEKKRRVYSEAINDLMKEEGIPYGKAKEVLNKRLLEKVIFNF
jgi:hypothetical protein